MVTSNPTERRKRRKAIDEPGHAHEFTFSCFRRLRLLDDPAIKDLYVAHLDQARQRSGFKIWAYVVMPEQVHLLLHPNEICTVRDMLSAVKSDFARQRLAQLGNENAAILSVVKVTRRDGSTRYRFWQAGGGFDRNMFSPKVIRASIDYIHSNPVRRGLCESIIDWPWSSARWYAGLDANIQLDRFDL